MSSRPSGLLPSPRRRLLALAIALLPVLTRSAAAQLVDAKALTADEEVVMAGIQAIKP